VRVGGVWDPEVGGREVSCLMGLRGPAAVSLFSQRWKVNTRCPESIPKLEGRWVSCLMGLRGPAAVSPFFPKMEGEEEGHLLNPKKKKEKKKGGVRISSLKWEIRIPRVRGRVRQQ